MKCALYFGTFNPLHKGHLAIIRYLLDNTGARQVRLVISPLSPFKTGQYGSLADDAQYREKEKQRRLEALREAVRRSALPVEVSDIEYTLPQPNFTIDTLRLIRKAEPENTHVLVMGSDNFEEIEKWRLWEELLDEFEVWIYPRPGHDVAQKVDSFRKMNPRWRITLFDAALHDISSSAIRLMEQEGQDASEFKA